MKLQRAYKKIPKAYLHASTFEAGLALHVLPFSFFVLAVSPIEVVHA